MAKRTGLTIMTAALLLGACGSAEARPSKSPVLSARPIADGPASLAPGKTRLANGAVAYVPPTAKGPRPLLVLLHGAGGKADRFLDRFVELADRERIVLLAVQSRGATWDLVPRKGTGGDGPLAMKMPAQIRFGDDVSRVDAALGELFGRTPVDPGRVALAGFSDGASYALSLGLANPQLFAGIIAMSPGFVMVPEKLPRAQRIFIAHGRRDKILSFRVAEHDILGLLVDVGLEPLFRPFEGDHAIDDAALSEGLDYALRKSAGADAGL